MQILVLWFFMMIRLGVSCVDLPLWRLFLRGGAMKDSHYFSTTSCTPTEARRVYLSVGSNQGDRYQNIAKGVQSLCEKSDVTLRRTSTLYETAPMYVTDQPSFLNGVVEMDTTLSPLELLRRIKDVERMQGRNFTQIRNGPRPLDMDICLFGNEIVTVEHNEEHDDDLIIPHARMAEREFVLRPLVNIGASDVRHPVLNCTIGQLWDAFSDPRTAVPVIPLPRGRMLRLKNTIVMGILNVTPDSFSDGGNYQGQVQLALKQALKMIQDGATIIDVGGESTRPGAKEVHVEEELKRTIPVIQGLRKLDSDIIISIDTRHAPVARAAIDAGADIVNDVSGGLFDSEMLETVAQYGVPMILMHMRGTPETMQSLVDYGKSSVVEQVAAELLQRSEAAQRAGIHRWQQILDPGIGFAKDLRGNLVLLKHYHRLQSMVGHLPLLLGTSRKGFIGKISGESNASDRDFGTLASSVAAICLGSGASEGNILRVHNVKGIQQGILVMDAIRQVDETS